MEYRGRCALVLLLFFSSSTVAQTAADQLKGTWSGPSRLCGRALFKIIGVEPSDIVRGTWQCPRRNLVLALGEKTEADKSVAAKFTDQKLSIEGANNSGYELVLEGNSLSGEGAFG